MSTAPFPTVKVTTNRNPSKGDPYTQFVAHYAKQYPALKQNAGDIRAAANEAKIDPIYFASTLLLESGANYQTADSSAGAVGIGQVMPLHIGDQVPWDPTSRVTMDNLRNPQFNLRFSAYYLASQIGQYGYANAYAGAPGSTSGGYNHGYTGNAVDPKGLGPLAFVEKWNGTYIPKTPSTTPPSPAGPQAPAGQGAVPADTRNTWAVKVTKGAKIVGVKFVNAAQPPANVLVDINGPMSAAAYNSWHSQYDDIWLAYANRHVTPAELANVITNGTSRYQLQLRLANAATFTRSPTYKAAAPALAAVWQSVFGPQSKPDQNAIKTAAARGIDGTAFAAQLRSRPDYTTSQEFKQNAATMDAVYRKVYGAPDEYGNATIQKAALGGWSPDEYAQWLRSQPEYRTSEEYKSKVFSLAQQLGLITGQMPTLTFAQASLGGGPAGAPATQQQAPPPAENPPAGEPKNVPPFTRPAAPAASPPVQGEPKNQAPFTRPA